MSAIQFKTSSDPSCRMDSQVVELGKQLFQILLAVFELLLYLFYVYAERLLRLLIPRALKSLDEEVILITGAGNGIGRALALQLARVAPKAKFICWDVDSAANDATVQALRRAGVKQAHGYLADVSDRAAVSRAAANIRRDVGHITIVVNNAGVCSGGPFLLQSPESLEKTFAVNLFAHFWILREFLPEMIRTNHGHIVTMASLSSWIPANDFACYSASKHAVQGFVDALKRELRAHPVARVDGIKFTTVYPAWVQTSIVEQQDIRPSFPMLCPPPLTPEYVAERTVEAMRQEYEYLYLPPSVKYFTFLCSLLPSEIQQKLLAGLFHCEFEHRNFDPSAVKNYRKMASNNQQMTEN